jgi:hypothetical protein
MRQTHEASLQKQGELWTKQGHVEACQTSQKAELDEYRGLLSELGSTREDMISREMQVTPDTNIRQNLTIFFFP